MVIGAFPAAKLGALLLKQISKPIANAVKSHAKRSPFFRKYVCMPPAQFYNWCEIKAKMWILNLGKPVNIPVLNEAMAIELGANLLGEGVIFLIAAGILINEYAKSASKEAAKEQARLAEMAQLQADIRELYIQAEEERAHIRELLRKIGEQDTHLQEIDNKLGIKRKPKSSSPPSSPTETPPYSPAALDPNIEKPNNTPVYVKNTVQYPNEGIILQAVNNIHSELWNYSNSENEGNILDLSIYHVSRLLKFEL